MEHDGVDGVDAARLGLEQAKPYPDDDGVATTRPRSSPAIVLRARHRARPSVGPARTIRSIETYLPDENTPAFTWLGPPAGDACSPSCNNGAPGHDDYVLPLRGATLSPRSRVPLARSPATAATS